jgi:hypothetical protein
MFSTWIGMVLLFAFFGLLALIVIGASPRGDTYEEKRAKVRTEKLQAVREETTKALTTYAWVDKSKGVVRIPIDNAMKLTVAELGHKTPAPANPIATPEVNPPAQAAPPTSTSPASSTAASPSGNQPAAANNPPPSPAGTQPGASNAPAAVPPPATTKEPVSTSGSPAPSAPATPSPVHGKTP